MTKREKGRKKEKKGRKCRYWKEECKKKQLGKTELNLKTVEEEEENNYDKL